MSKKTIAIDSFIDILEKNYPQWDAPVITLMAGRGKTPFELLISTVLSLRTKDQVTAKASRRLFAKARTPGQVLLLAEKTIADLIYPVGFYTTKAKQIKKIARIVNSRYKGQVPDRIEDLLEFPGVGRKTANLVLSEAFHQDAICVDTHVHRISNRIGYIGTKSVEHTEKALCKKLPRKYWRRYNTLLVAFGQVLCKPVSPFCSRCEIAFMCPRIGVLRHR